MHVHFIGVAGTGMGSLAGLFKAAGHDVSGSDVAFYPPMGPALERWGVRLMQGYDPAHLEPRPDLVVVGNVCRPTNPEARAAIDAGIPYRSMPHALAEHLLPGTAPLVVAGTHGKTTTSTLCAHVLMATGREPGFLVGGIPLGFEASHRLPKKRLPQAGLPGAVGGAVPAARRPPFVIEGDEYDTAFFEKTPKFWHYQPEVAIVTSIEHDHVDIYPELDQYLATFAGFVARVPPGGLVVACAAEPRVVEIVGAHAQAPVTWYGLEGDDFHGMPPEWVAAPATRDERGQSFDLFAGGSACGRVVVPLSGDYNARNALAAIAAAAQGYGVPVRDAAAALARFGGVKRRQELVGEARGVRVYDDFAHHPTAVAATLRALRERHREGRLVAVYEPRSATACRRVHQQAYESAFEAASRVVFAPVGRPELPEQERLDLPALVAALGARGARAELAGSIDAIVDGLAPWLEPGDTVALLSNGAFGGIHEKLLARLRAAAARDEARPAAAAEPA
ncbi:MAG: UDP-N-acetylmuramate:L-alanyl-gamma-D-glutamyl-meso-diaminopimelate ligase [Myxococcales bacterium]|nr:UDP-N-acetylmuramate:L-alanyl-gamma-D-glutamyl-meso-diaminopimelate ligase [Myxococcales bacterium]